MFNGENFAYGEETCDANTIANIDVNIGWVPKAVEVYNEATGAKLWWTEGMTDGYGNKYAPTGLGILHKITISLDASNKKNVNMTAFTVVDKGTAKNVSAAQIAPAASKTITKAKWGLLGFSVAVDGTVDNAPDSNTYAYNTEALAIAGRNAVAASHTDVGYITVLANSAANYVTGTNTLDQADEVNYYGLSNVMSEIITGGIYMLSGTTTNTINAGTTASGTIGFRIGTDTDIQQTSAVLRWKAWR